MTVVLDKITDVQSSVVDTISSVKEPVVKGVSTVVDFVVERLPEIPVVPYADQIPTPAELVRPAVVKSVWLAAGTLISWASAASA